MQAPTHAIVGIFIQLIITSFLTQELYISFLIISLAFFSHFILDAMAKATYHPPDPLPDDSFWVGYHVFILISIVALGIFLLPFFWLGILAANAVDIWDWLIIRKMANHKNNPDWGKRFRLHPLADLIRRKLFYFLPDLGHDKRGAIPEIILILACFSSLLAVLVAA